MLVITYAGISEERARETEKDGRGREKKSQSENKQPI